MIPSILVDVAIADCRRANPLRPHVRLMRQAQVRAIFSGALHSAAGSDLERRRRPFPQPMQENSPCD